MEIKFCENNFTYGTEGLSEKLKAELDDVEVIIESCLGYCSDCANGPYALVDDEVIQADTVEELYEMIEEKLHDAEE